MTINKKKNNAEPVAKCDRSKEVITNSCLGKHPVGPSGDNPQETSLSQYDIEKLIKKVNKKTGLKNGQLTNLIV